MSRICCGGGETLGGAALKHARSEATQGRMQVQLVLPLGEEGGKAIYTGDSGKEEEGHLHHACLVFRSFCHGLTEGQVPEASD